ncbi:MAG: 50S ribosomal protein L25/general stress protein Ctc [Rickettsiaceae bacterium]|nr:50S ribosomal protein L25/general stress protein Ctc [Rickettsiaceae bacterium]
MNDIVTLKAQLRTKIGTGPARELRRNGMIPAIIYGANKEPLAIAIEEREITKYYKKPLFLSQLFEFDIDGTKYKVLPKTAELHLIKEMVTHVDFIFVEDEVQKMSVPIVYLNKTTSIGIKRGGYFNTVRRVLNISCPVKSLPRSLEIDVAKTKIGESIKASQVKLPEGAVLLDNPNFVIASIIGKKGKAGDLDAEEGKAA